MFNPIIVLTVTVMNCLFKNKEKERWLIEMLDGNFHQFAKITKQWKYDETPNQFELINEYYYLFLNFIKIADCSKKWEV